MRRRQRGFTLLEVVISLAILALSLTVLLQSQAASLANAGRSRDVTVASLLARGKMIDIEKKLFHDGFTVNSDEDTGDFRDDGFPDITWKARVSEVELDLSALTSLCGSLAKKSESKDTSVGDCESQLGGMGAMMGGFTEELGRSLRVVDLLVSWSEGKYTNSMSVRALVTRDDFQTQQETDAMRTQRQVDSAIRDAGGVPGGGQ